MCKCKFVTTDTIYEYHATVRYEASFDNFVTVELNAGDCATILDAIQVIDELYAIVESHIEIVEVFPCRAENM